MVEFFMPRGKSDKVTFKPYDQTQAWLLPPSLEELVPDPHLVRVVSATIDEMDLEAILRKYTKGGGASRYHPVMMLKILVYGYMSGTTSSRLLAKALRENVLFMWLAGNQKPDFRTINLFRSERLKDVIEEVFVATAKLLQAKGYIKLENYFIDGTKIESAAGKYTFVWKRATDTNNRKLDDKLKAFVRAINDVNDDETKILGNNDIDEWQGREQVTAEDIKDLAGALKERLAGLGDTQEAKPVKKKLKKAIRQVEQDFLIRKEKYERYLGMFDGRNSFSKTDPDATFMRMKEDAMLNGQLKPGYNIQIGCENGFVVGYDIFPNPTDTRTLIPHLENVKRRLGRQPACVIADAGYGSEENYAYCDRSKIQAAIKYSMWQKEQKRSWRKNRWNTDNWHYDCDSDQYECPMGKRLGFERQAQRRTGAGYNIQVRTYRCHECMGCPQRTECCTSNEGRTIQRNEHLLRLKAQAREFLASPEGTRLMRRRSHEVETVFGQLKANQGFRRFRLKGRLKVAVEWGLLALGYNLKQLMAF